MKHFAIILVVALLAGSVGVSQAQSYEEYRETWRDRQRARFITYRYDLQNKSFEQAGYVSDRPLEWSNNLGAAGDNELVDPFDYSPDGGPTAKHVLVIVHGYGPGPLLGGDFDDRDEAFSTQDVGHHSGATLWFQDDSGPSLYSYLRDSTPTAGFDPAEWVILAVSMDITQGSGLSILENQTRLRALMDLLWHHKKSQIRTISFASHSTGSPIVKGVLGGSDTAEHPWIGYVDDHLNLAGALGGTQMVLFDAPAAVGAPDLRHQLMYGIQHPIDYTGDFRYHAGLTAADGTTKRTYRWPAHVDVLSVAGVWRGRPADGNPWSGDEVDIIPWNLSNPADPRFLQIYESKSDGVVPSMSVIEHVQYKEIDLNPLPGDPFEWRHQIESGKRYGVDYSSSWTLPNLGAPPTITTNGGGGWIPLGVASPADAIPATDRFPGEKVTYVEVEAQHNGMLHNEHLLRALRKRLGTYTVPSNVERPRVTALSQHSGPLAGGNTIQIYGTGFRHVTRILFGEIAVSEPRVAGAPPDWTVDSETQITVEVPEGIPWLQGDPVPPPVNVQVANAAGWSQDNGAADDYRYTVPAATPVIDPDGGTFDAPPLVTLSTQTPGTTIYYTLDGTDPRPGNGKAHAYAAPFAIAAPLTGDPTPYTLKARAVGAGYADSPVASAVFSVDARVAAPTIFPDGGDFTGFVNVTLGTATPGATIYYTADGSEPTYNSTSYTGSFRLEVGDHEVKARAYRIAYNESPVNSATFRVYDPSAERTADPVLYPLGSGGFTDSVAVRMIDYAEGAQIHFTIGENEAPEVPTEASPVYTDPFVLGYNEEDVNQGGTSWFIRAKAFKGGLPPSNVVQRAYTVAPGLDVTAAPTFAPAAGPFDNDTTITLASATPFARLYYTTDGSEAVYDPDLQSHATPRTLDLTRTTTVRAIAKRPFFSTSEEVAAEFVFQNATPEITAEPTTAVHLADERGEADVYVDSVEVSLSTATAGATLRYTLDGSEPGEEAAEYDGPFHLSRPATVTVRAFKTGYLHSELATETFVVQSGEAPVVTRHPESQQVEAGADVVFSAAAVAIPEPSFQWQFDGADLGRATSDSLRLSNVQASNAGTYRLIVRNAAGADTSDTAMLVVAPALVAPVIITQPDSQHVSVGGVHTFSVGATGKPLPSYQWLKEDTLIADADSSEFTLRNVQPTDEGRYRVVVRNRAGTDTSDVGYLSVTPSVAPTIIEHPVDASVVVGDTARFSVQVAGEPAPSYRWLYEGAAIPQAAASMLILPDVQSSDAGAYLVIAFNVAGIDTSRSAALTIAGGTPVDAPGDLPAEFALHANYPNPFNPSTTIAFDLPQSAEVALNVYDVLGRRVMRRDQGSLEAGRYRETLDFSELASGMYFYEIRVEGSTETLFREVKRLVLVK